ncbi:MAG TPA: hypothetical protein VKA37_02125, partial [Halobacteriales archaeon]|nr:hypothetical protein [Halobacteriales archaeon]
MIVLQAGGSTSPLPHLVVFVVGIGIAWVIRALARRRGTTQATLTKGGVAILVVLFVLLVGGSFASLGDPVVSGLFAVMVGVPLLLGLRAWAKREDPAGQQTEPEGGQTAPAERQTASVSSTGEPHSRVPEGPSNEESEAFGEVGSDEQGSSDEQVGPDGRDEPVHRKEQPIWRGAGLRSIVRSGRFTLGGLVVFVTLAV